MTLKTTYTLQCDLCQRTKTFGPQNEAALKGWLNLTIAQHAGSVVTDAHVCPGCHARAPALVQLLRPVSASRDMAS